ncbi:MAG: alpha/beta hydrolase-fold protein [Bacteroidota bacterium]
MKPLFNLCFFIFFFYTISGQTVNTYSTNALWQSASSPFSPVVSRSGEISFRIMAPNASKVSLLFGEWDIKPKLLEKDTAGIWSIKIGPVSPGIYSYLFSIDGSRSPDLHNPIVKTGTELYSSIVEVPGVDSARFDEIQTVPHCTLQIVRYNSTPLKILRKLYICLPPSYYTSPNKHFPVLYLRHGGGDNESSWTQESGRADVILENLIASNKAVPMIIVMSNGLTDGTWAGGSSKEGMILLEDELLTDIIPYMENNFRVLKGGNNRAIAGLSMGGGQAYIIGLRHTDTVSWIGEFSSGLLSDVKFDINERVPGVFNNPSVVNESIKLLFIGCGSDDPRFQGHLELDANLKKLGIHHETYTMHGGHEWKVWREELRLFMTRIFK